MLPSNWLDGKSKKREISYLVHGPRPRAGDPDVDRCIALLPGGLKSHLGLVQSAFDVVQTGEGSQQL
jgi:hypothetical protein